MKSRSLIKWMLLGVCVLSAFGCTTASPSDVASAEASLTRTQRNELLCLTLSLATPGVDSSAERSSFRRGCVLYHNETFGGNGRTCTSCHLLEVGNGNPDDNNFDLSIEDVESAFSLDPTGPLFRSIDANDGASDFTTLRTLADVRIPIGLHANVSVVDDGSPLISDDARTVSVWRSTPTSENIVFEHNLMWDGRFGADLPRQSREAVSTHYQPGRLPTVQEQTDMAFFQANLFSNERLRLFAEGGPPPALPEVPTALTGSYWNSVRRGRNFFVDMPVSSTNPVRGGHCATCHSGPMLNQTNVFNPVQAPGESINNNFVSELNFLRPPETQLPAHTYHIVLDHPVFMPDVPIAHSPFMPPPGTPLFPPGTVFTVTSPDLGLSMVNGNPCIVPAACLLNSPPGSGVFGTTSFFKTPTLWGAADSAPYFHDNSARDIREAMESVYVPLFSVTADGLNQLGLDGEPLRFTPQDVEDIINYFEYGFRHRPVLAP